MERLQWPFSSSITWRQTAWSCCSPINSSVIFGRIKSRKATTTRMPIVRLREANCNQDKELPDIESKRLRCRPSRAHLLTSIAYLRHKSSTKMLKDSKKLIQQSSQLIVETEFSLRGDYWGPSYRSPQWNDCNSLPVTPLLDDRMPRHWIADSRDTPILHGK